VSVYLGRPGQLVAIKSPRRGVDRTRAAVMGVHEAVEGTRTVDYVGGAGRQTWTMQWAFLPADQVAFLRALHQRTFGAGPYVLIDPATRNYLSDPVSSASSPDAAAGLFNVTNGTVALSATPSGLSPLAYRCYAWSLTTATGPVWLDVKWRHGTYGVPVVPGAPYSARVLVSSTVTLPVRLDIAWFDVAGVYVSSAVGTPAATPASFATFGERVVSGVCPPGAAFGIVQIQVPSPAVGAVVGFDGLSLEPFAEPRPWSPGEDVPRVALTAFPDRVPLVGYHDVTATFVEVG
jgi:hypothetical protein